MEDLLWQENISYIELEGEDLERLTNDGGLFYRDFEGIIKDVATFVPRVYKKAIIKGLAFTARGKQYREGMQAFVHHHRTAAGQLIKQFGHTNNLNTLATHWWNSEDYSSWCRVHYKDPRDPVGAAPRVEMAQSNYFFRLNYPSDRAVHGLAFGDMCIRNTKYDAKRRHYFVTPADNCFNGGRQFVCLNNVCSTKLALSVIDCNLLPLIRKRKFGSARWIIDKDSIKLAPSNSTVDRIYFLEMHPERVNYSYLPFLEDKDGTKNWDVVRDVIV
jgi:hypothetical protein